MKMIYEYLKSFRALRWLHSKWYWFQQEWLRIFPKCLVLRLHYEKRLRHTRAKFGKRPIRVLFPVCNPAKWKMQSLYEAMAASPLFEPVICITILDREQLLSEEGKRKHILDTQDFFSRRGMSSVVAYDARYGGHRSYADFSPDIVWFQDPWSLATIQSPQMVARFALTCYTPYFVQNYGDLGMDCKLPFHRFLWRHFTLNPSWANVFERTQGLLRAGRSVGLGHPMLDCFQKAPPPRSNRPYVIYAPHWSCGVGECYSTFLKCGKQMLELAQAHPEISWVFKPHPTLRSLLRQLNLMPKAEIEAYFGAWERLGHHCYDGDYVELFRHSNALITDCGSFLVEYACTGNPIIHLISSERLFPPHPVSATLFDTYYQAHNWEEFMRHFEAIVLKGEDPKREERLQKVKALQLLHTHAATNIIDYITKVLKA